jgi:HD-GYP domain-containing protein (c-di-GMP phosphodiesterase class II)
LLKPGKLTSKEFEEIKKHTVIGARPIDIALYHHEKFDGSGYPEGLRGEEIPLSARILALVDSYDTITSKRPYKEAVAHEEAVKRIVSDTGRHFDPGVVNAFLKKQGEFKKINFKREIELLAKN